MAITLSESISALRDGKSRSNDVWQWVRIIKLYIPCCSNSPSFTVIENTWRAQITYKTCEVRIGWVEKISQYIIRHLRI